MGGNESREVGGSEVEGADGELGIYRDLLEVDGCESGWMGGGCGRGDVEEMVGKDGIEAVLGGDGEGGEGDGEGYGGMEVGGEDKGRGKATEVHEGHAQQSTPQTYVEPRSVELAQTGSKNTTRISALTTDEGELLLTPKGRPLAEPLIINYDEFVRNYVPSPGKLKLMFGDDVRSITTYRDALTETNLLAEYANGVLDLMPWGKMDYDDFYRPLWRGIQNELAEVRADCQAFIDTFTPLLRWEAHKLSNDDDKGNLNHLMFDLKNGVDPFIWRVDDPVPEEEGNPNSSMCSGDESGVNPSFWRENRDLPEARQKYGYIVDMLPRRPAHDMATWLHYRRAAGKIDIIFSPCKSDIRFCSDEEAGFRKHWNISRIFCTSAFGGFQAWEEFKTFSKDAKDADGAPLRLPDEVRGLGPNGRRLHQQLLKFWDERVFPSEPSDTGEAKEATNAD